MNVQAILKRKGRDVATIPCSATLREAAQQLKAKGIGALVILDEDGALAGIISERDIVNAMAEEGEAAASRSVCDFMTTDVRTVGLSDTTDRLMEIMTHARMRHLPVIENGKLAGIVSIGDVVKQRMEEIAFEAEQMKNYIATG